MRVRFVFPVVSVLALTYMLGNNLGGFNQCPTPAATPDVAVIPAAARATGKAVAGVHQASWKEEVERNLAAREYTISWNAENAVHQSPNRAHNTRITYTPARIHITPRILELYTERDRMNPAAEPELLKTYEDFTLDMQVLGYGTEEQLTHVFKPAALSAEANTAQVGDDAMQVEYVNNEKGTRQNFIITRPVNGEELAVHMHLATTLTAKQVDEGIIRFTGSEKSTLYHYSDLNVWDATGRRLPAHMQLETEAVTDNANNYRLLLAVNTSDAVYPITIDPIVSSGTPSNANTKVESGQDDAWMGWAVSSAGDVNGDGYSDVVVGAYQYANGQADEGAAFVYHGSASGINTTPVITLEGNQAGAYMGWSVSGAGDINNDTYSDLIVGANAYSNGQAGEGAAFLYHGTSSGISGTPSATLEGNVAGAAMGYAVSFAGDVNRDNYSDVVVGATSYANGQSNEGAVFVFRGSASGINTTPQTTIESNQANAYIGWSVDGAGDVNGDSYSDIIYGAPYYDNGQTDEGGAFLHLGSSVGINATVTTIIESNQANAHMGWSVSNAGDVNGDGYADVLMGAPEYDNNAYTDEGLVYLYKGIAGSGISGILCTLEGLQTSAALGSAVSCAGDVNGDGYSDILIGAYYYDNGNTDEGAAMVFHGGGYSLVSTGVVAVESNVASTELGGSLACAGDVNGDGYSDIIVGAVDYDNGQNDEGAVFIYHGSSSGINTTAAASMEGNLASGSYGYSVAGGGDVNGDGYSDVLVAFYSYTNGQNGEGAAMVYHGSASGINTTAATILETNTASQGVSCVADAGDVNRDGYSDVLVGSLNYTNGNGQTQEGCMMVFLGGGTGVSTTLHFRDETNINQGWMGNYNGISGLGDVNGDGYGDISAGAQRYTNGQTYEGAAYVYYGSSAGITAVNLTLESNVTSAQLGYRTGCAGDVNGDGYNDLLVSAQSYANGQSSEGAVYVFHGSSSGIGTTPAVILESNTASANMYACAGAGDINGDGYSDVLAGAPSYSNGQNYEGLVMAYLGSPTGVSTTPTFRYENNLGSSYLGNSSSAGDVNGDGFSDIIVGSGLISNGQTYEGAWYCYYGNALTGGATGRRNNFRMYNTDLSTPIQQSNAGNSNMGVGLYTTSFQSRHKVKLVWEVKAEGQPFSSGGGNISNSVSSSGAQASYTNTGTSGIELKSSISKSGGVQTKVRVRVQYDMASSITGQKYGPWRYPQGYVNGHQGMSNTPLPVSWLGFDAVWLEPGVSAQLTWSTASEKNNHYFTVLRSTDGTHWEERGQVPGAGNSNTLTEYQFPDKDIDDLNGATVYYRIMQTDYNGEFSFSPVRTLDTDGGMLHVAISPNPSAGAAVITFSGEQKTGVVYTVTDVQGREYLRGAVEAGSYRHTLNTSSLPSGVYLIHFSGGGGYEYTTKLVQK